MTDGKLYKTMEFLMNAFLLNTLWLIMCLPVVTIFPATAAMFAVVREWGRRPDIRMTASFFRHFRENFGRSFLVGGIWTGFILMLAGDLWITNRMDTSLKYFFFAFFFLLAIIFLFVTCTIFPVLVHYKGSARAAIKNAFLLSIARLHNTVFAAVVLGIAIAVVFRFPGAMLLVFCIAAYLVYTLISRGFPHGQQPAEEEISSL